MKPTADGLDDQQRAQLHELLTPDEARALLDRLDGFRACDPAVGSGAFLVGLLHELVNLHRLCGTRSRGKDPATDLEWLYETKKRVIERVLYGVDLQQRAVEICKLRLWISLMVDYPLEVDPDNCALPDFRKALKKITPLPNLDFKIRRANSLIEQIRGHAVRFPQTAADSRDFNLSLNQLASAKHRFYEARKKKEKRLTQLDILEATAELARYEFSAAKLKYGLLPSDKDAERAAELDCAEAEMGKLQLQIAAARKKGERDKDGDIERLSRVFNDEAKPTFVWQLDFAEIFHRQSRQGGALPAGSRGLSESASDTPGGAKSETHPGGVPASFTAAPLLAPLRGAGVSASHSGGVAGAQPPATGSQPSGLHSGFDLVIGNPPYVRQEKIKELKPFLQNAYDCYTGTADLYVYFYERAVKLLGKGGVLSFISSNKFFRVAYGEKLRTYLRERTELQTIIDFGDLPIFEATAYPCIVVTSNRKPKAGHEARTLNIKTMAELSRFTELASTSTAPRAQTSLGDDSWKLETPLTLRLLEKIRRDGKPLREFVGARVYRGITTGFNEAFVIDLATRDTLIAVDKSSSKLIKPYLRGRDVNRWSTKPVEQWLIFTRRCGLNIEDFPAIKKHLNQFKKQLMPGELGGRKPGSYEWFEIQDNIAYWQEFSKPKIVSTKVSIRPTFAFDTDGSYLGNTSYFFTTSSDSHFLLGLLNSSLFHIYAKKVFVEKQGGWFEVQPDGLESFPIPTAPAAERSAIEGLVEQCLAARGKNCGAWEAEINARVARLYNLTPAEIQLVEEATKK